MAEKVVHISTVHPPFDVRIFHKECKSLKKAGYEVFLVVTHEKDEVRDGIQILSLPQSSNRFQRIFFKPWHALRKALSTGASIFHFHDPELIPIGFLLRMLGKKVIYDVHEDYSGSILHKYWISKKIRLLLSKIFGIFEKFNSRFFNAIIAATPDIQNSFTFYNKNTKLINNYPIINELLNDENIQKKPDSIAYIGGITKERGFIELLEAIEGTKVKLYLAGQFSPKSFKDECIKKKGWSNVEYIGVVDRVGIFELLKSIRIGIITFHNLPNHDECRPNKMFEYMLASIPIVASNISSWEKFLNGINCAKFVDPLNPLAIREQILYLLSHPDEAEEMGKAGQNAVLEKFNWGAEEANLLQIYDGLIYHKKK